jgi:serine/threonine protein kinase
MATLSPPHLCAAIRTAALLAPEQQQELDRDLLPNCADLKGLANELLRRGWLTPFQLNKLAAGRSGELILGPYVLQSLLGEGAMGKVFKAEHRRLKRPAALKVIRPEHLAAPGAVDQFHREAQAAARLDHPNIIRVYDANEADGVHFIAMEFIEGADLARVVKERGPLPVATACHYARQAALGLEHAHARGLIHRDVKPSNMLLDGDTGVVKLLDLGIARLDRSAPTPLQATATGAGTVMGVGASPATHSMTATASNGAVIGTPDFVAPEQARDSRKVDARADVYSLGCTLYYLLTGLPPFRGDTPVDTLLRHMTEEAKPLEQLRTDLPPELGPVVRKLMARQVEDRYPTAAAAAAALAPFVGAATTALPPQSSAALVAGSLEHTPHPHATLFGVGAGPDLSRLRKTNRRFGLLVAAVGLVATVGVLTIVGGVLWTRSGSTPTSVAVAPPSSSSEPVATARATEPAPPKPTNPERQAAERVLQLGGRMLVVVGNEKPTPVTTLAELPAGAFKVVGVELNDPKITDADLQPLKDFPRLRYLTLSGTHVRGPFLRFLPRAPEIERLNVSNTDFPDAALRVLEIWPALRALNLSKTPVTDEGMHSVNRLRHLTELHLDDTVLSDKGLEALDALTELIHLSLNGTRLTDDGLGLLKRYRNLKTLHLDSVEMTDGGLQHLEPLSLDHLTLHNTPISDKGLEHLYNQSHLQSLTITRTNVTADGVDHLRRKLGVSCKIDADVRSRWPGPRRPRDMLKPPA